jgi:hypothetical protein
MSIYSVTKINDPTPTTTVSTFPTKIPEEVPHWLVATAGTCSSLVEFSVSESLNIEFSYTPRTYIRFTDYPLHQSVVYNNQTKMIADLADEGWDHRNVGLIIEAPNFHHEISIYEITEHSAKSDNTLLWKGRVVNQTSNNVSSINGSFNCSLFVDASALTIPKDVFITSIFYGINFCNDFSTAKLTSMQTDPKYRKLQNYFRPEWDRDKYKATRCEDIAQLCENTVDPTIMKCHSGNKYVECYTSPWTHGVCMPRYPLTYKDAPFDVMSVKCYKHSTDIAYGMGPDNTSPQTVPCPS